MALAPPETSASQPSLSRFLGCSLARLRWGTLAALFLITVVWPTPGRFGIASWVLVLVFAGYNLLLEVLGRGRSWQHPLRWMPFLDLPLAGILYFLGGEPGGPLFVLFFLAVDSAAAGLSLRGTVLYTGVSAATAAGVDLVLTVFSPSDSDVRMIGARIVMLTLLGVGMAIVTRRLTLEHALARSGQDQAEQMGELDRLRTSFISTISHELRTPLTASRAGLGLLEESASERLLPEELELLSNARRNNERLTVYIGDLLSFNQLEAGTLRLDREVLDLRMVITDSLSAVYPLILQKGQTLEIDLPEPLPYMGDARQLEQVVVNVLVNAQRHTPADTRIVLSGSLTDTDVGFTVSDTGPGVEPEELEAIFQRFHRLAAEVEGSGLGLAIARRIVDLHGGRMWAESKPGDGASFHVVLARNEKGVMA